MNSIIMPIIERNIDKLKGISGYQRHVLNKVLNCRSEVLPQLSYQCDTCGARKLIYKSCKDRICPVCNGAQSLKWMAKREVEFLPVPYFLLTFTVPKELRPIFLLNQQSAYNLLFESMSKTLLNSIKTGRKDFHGNAGFFAILHTWDQRRNYHPHLHVVIPAGCLSADNTNWVPARNNFLLPVRKVSADFRDRFFKQLSKRVNKEHWYIPEELHGIEGLLAELQQKPWVVHSSAPERWTRKPECVLRYLARYVHKQVMSEDRIVKVENGLVSLSWYDRKRKQAKIEKISEELFLKRMVLHILPKGFKKVRFYGFMANRCRNEMLALCRMLLGESLSVQESVGPIQDTAFLLWKYFRIDITKCPHCDKGHLVLCFNTIDSDGG